MLIVRFFRRHCRQICNACLISVFCLHPVWADDTEIFFRPIGAEASQPNILFVLDNSGSMNSLDEGPLTRVQRMNAAMAALINSVSNVNIGVMRFSHTDNGGRIIYPVSNIEQPLCDGVPCTNAAEFDGTVTSTRQALIDSINEMVMDGGTPTVGALIEASRYFKGHGLLFGNRRLLYADNANGHLSRVSHPDSYTGGELNQPDGCTPADLSDPNCVGEVIDGSPIYKSPITNECQENHIVLVSDGIPSLEWNGRNIGRIISGVPSCVDAFPGFDNGRCGAEMAAHLFNTDMRADIPGSNVITHTVGFELDSPWLESIAEAASDPSDADAPRGTYTTAETSNDLVEAFSDIFESIDSGATFVAPGITIDQFSRLSHREDVYLSLFKPSNFPGWQGNLKGYTLKGAKFLGEDGLPAVDVATGQFIADSQSYWSDGVADGLDITLGGAAARLDHNNRKAVTYTGTINKNLFHDDNKLDPLNTLVQINTTTGGGTAVNVAPQGTASQSTTSHSGAPGRAIDGNTSGVYNNASVTHTDGGSPDLPWWEVELSDEVLVDRVVLYNRTDGCCDHRLNNVHVFVSDTPFGNATLAELTAQTGIWHQYIAGQPSTVTELPVAERGKYVRVQLAQPGALSLAEVEVFGSETTDPLVRADLLNWIRGMDVKDANGDQSTTDNRGHMGDPLHSTSVTVTYGGDAADPDSVVFVGTNEGYLHAISSRTGEEEFAFMPEVLFENIETLFDNNSFEDKVYGMDGDLTLWANDTNNNGLIDANTEDRAYLYAGMRRGGEQYYALNITDRASPEFMFSIPESDPAAFAELGQTWSKPLKKKVKVAADDVRDVLIFAGGYDESQDDKATRLPDTKGRAIYIVDALTGKVLWSGQPTANALLSTKVFPDMKYSIPSDLVVLEQDGLASQIYVGDMGGQIWRFDIKNDGSTGSDLVDGGVIADLGADNSPAGTRRFYHAPDLVLSKFEGKTVINIGIGSGYRAHPLNTQIVDNFYLIRYPFKATGNYGLDQDGTGPGTTFLPIEMDDLFDTTDNLIGEGNETQISDAQDELRDKTGWFIEMERNGEKILGSATTLKDVIRFISYVPGVNDLGACVPDLGESFFYRVSLLDGTPVGDPNDDGTKKLKKEDRDESAGDGAKPSAQAVFGEDEDDGSTNATFTSGVDVLETVDDLNTTRRWYWAETPE